MGFLSVDEFLVDLFVAKFKEAQSSELVIDDTFDDRPVSERAKIKTYLTKLRVTDNLQDKGDNYLYIMPQFPQTTLPFPQIGISLGSDDTAEKFIGDYTGEAVEIKDSQNNVIAHDIEKGYWGAEAWNIDVVTETKPETSWLSALCKRFICESLDDLDAIGVKEVAVARADLRLEERLIQTNAVFNRPLRVTAKVANTWHKRIPVGTYQTGNNLGLE